LEECGKRGREVSGSTGNTFGGDEKGNLKSRHLRTSRTAAKKKGDTKVSSRTLCRNSKKGKEVGKGKLSL